MGEAESAMAARAVRPTRALMNICDPRDVAGDGRTNTVLTFPFTTIEDVLVLDNNRLLVINDNNFPFSSGREFGVADNDELIVIHTAPLLPEEKECRDREKGRRGRRPPRPRQGLRRFGND